MRLHRVSRSAWLRSPPPLQQLADQHSKGPWSETVVHSNPSFAHLPPADAPAPASTTAVTACLCKGSENSPTPSARVLSRLQAAPATSSTVTCSLSAAVTSAIPITSMFSPLGGASCGASPIEDETSSVFARKHPVGKVECLAFQRAIPRLLNPTTRPSGPPTWKESRSPTLFLGRACREPRTA
jgi:hypothetical protein